MTLPDADEHIVDPEQLRIAAEELFDLEQQMERECSSLVSDGYPVENAASRLGLSLGNQLGITAAHWRQVRMRGSRNRVVNIGQFLATHAETSIDIDEFSASEFRQFADSDRFPVATSRSGATPGSEPLGEQIASV
ncbi:hypothetical protein [Natronoglycomyces albus]|uniref:Uncharacterized protein n=1 Tax=Natronoglycomyces albus TaxID=2811108 RepID=A0A895XUV2_9ACTN|nr:hypothetical protein [Natronoglycomyces albus]QSB05428.1 hypothetical protein JQS30_00325 [Natronoglycomyces albus]